jgi:cytosine permease
MPDQTSSLTQRLDQLYEFDREPVSSEKLQPGKYFAASFAGEHVAGTEFVIGALFVVWGARAIDIFLGLLLGNALAVLTWTFVCTPIAVQTRLTLYWYLRKIAGPITTMIYNVLNALLFMVLAGCMITVSASAVRIPFGIPAQTNWYPEDVRFVLVAIVVGAVVITLAILGFKKLAQFASVCSPWMFIMFFAGALAMLPGIAANTPGIGQITSVRDFWELANRVIWTGVAPAGKTSMSFWQVAAFAWICNLAMHGGLSDMALFRYARRVSYGLFSSFGMFLGHYVAWICAGLMGAGTALILKTSISNLDAGGVAYQSLGIAGIIAVVIAGWTTSNPTLYRAGLALQAVIPWPRWLVTLIVGALTTIVACFPFVFTKLLDFVGYYGLLLMPVGAIVFVEHWIFPRIGFTQYWVSRKKILFSWPALASWFIAIAVAITLKELQILHLFFLFIPVWLLTSILYIVFAAVAGARNVDSDNLEEYNASKTTVTNGISQEKDRQKEGIDTGLLISRILALGSLAVCVILPIWIFIGGPESYDQRFAIFKSILIWPTLLYFVTGTIWAAKKDK